MCEHSPSLLHSALRCGSSLWPSRLRTHPLWGGERQTALFSPCSSVRQGTVWGNAAGSLPKHTHNLTTSTLSHVFFFFLNGGRDSGHERQTSQRERKSQPSVLNKWTVWTLRGWTVRGYWTRTAWGTVWVFGKLKTPHTHWVKCDVCFYSTFIPLITFCDMA